MKRHPTIAMGLINSPHLLFLDEPTSGLKVQSNLIVRDVISKPIRDGITVLTTHDIEEENLTCDRVEIINGRFRDICSITDHRIALYYHRTKKLPLTTSVHNGRHLLLQIIRQKAHML